MSKILITGGIGFIGSYTVQRLIKLGHEVAIFDNFVHYVYPLNQMHLENIIRRTQPFIDDVKVYRGSIVDQDFLRRSITDFSPDHIIHLAAMPISKLATEHPEEAVDVMARGTLNLLEVISTLDSFGRFVYISSSMVYGDFIQNPMPEGGIKKPIDIYGSMKLAGEHLTRAIARKSGLDFTIVRPSAVYGPTDNNKRVLTIFLDNALSGKPLEVKGRSESLDFTYVTDIADGIICALFSENANGNSYNITRGRSRTILEAAQIVANLIPGTTINVQESDADMPSRGTLDISRAQREIGYSPRIDLEQGLERLYQYRLEQSDHPQIEYLSAVG